MSVYDSLTEVIQSDGKVYEQSEKYNSFTAADKVFDDLVKRGLAERRGNCLMPLGNRFSINNQINT